MKRFLLAFATLFAGLAAYAQVTTSSMSGQIADEFGEPLIGAAVVAVHEPSGTQYYAITNNDGRYTITGMRSGGPYKVEISFIGMATEVHNDVTLLLGEIYTINANLKSSEQLNEVVVVASTSKFTTTKTGAGTNISLSQMEELPSVNRSIQDIAKLSPYANGMSFAGADGRSTNFTVDGANFNNNFGLSANLPGGGNPISMDAFQEVQVVIAPYDVRQTNFIGASVNAITKSGTNT
ncbi:MAG: carboxypeptidase regulatory-like domain-containing protein, partial [Bacteroidales bacterium]|nr:carboxypeptidase regulatory-like domain-containing protein [Bacteroidales bacterium]